MNPNDSHIYIFNHIPKCGGTTTRSALREWFEVVEDYRGGWGEESLSRYIENTIDLDSLKPGQILCGHYTLNPTLISVRYPRIYRDNRYRLITFLRDPFEAVMSLYKYEQRNEVNQGRDVGEWLTQRGNFFARALECNESNYQEVLSRYAFIGNCEALQASMDVLAHELGKPSVDLGSHTHNVAPAFQDFEMPTEEQIAMFKRNCELDYKIYHFSRESFKNRLLQFHIENGRISGGRSREKE